MNMISKLPRLFKQRIFSTMLTLMLATIVAAEISSCWGSSARVTPQDIAWELERGVSSANTTVSIPKKGSYVFVILFHTDQYADPEEVKNFLGDGSYRFESSGNEVARRLVPGVDGSLAMLNDMANQGKIVRRSAHPGTAIPVKLDIGRVDTKDTSFLTRTINTEGVSGFLSVGPFRTIAEPNLDPGEYDVRVQALDLPPFPQGIHAFLAIFPPWRY